MKEMWVYIMANRSRTLYVGVTNDITRRVWEHKHMQIDGFTRRYLIDRLVYYESAPGPETAIVREKQLKGWLRRRKVSLIESVNPKWRDLSLDFLDIRPAVSPKEVIQQERGRRDSSLLGTRVNTRTVGVEESLQIDRRAAQNDEEGSP
jgi:putative endonuclease